MRMSFMDFPTRRRRSVGQTCRLAALHPHQWLANQKVGNPENPLKKPGARTWNDGAENADIKLIPRFQISRPKCEDQTRPDEKTRLKITAIISQATNEQTQVIGI